MYRACVVGKGPSYAHWQEVEADIFYSCNSVIEKVKKGVLVQRDLGPIFDISRDITLVAPRSVCESYGHGLYYTWAQIPKMCAACTAIFLADAWEADEIIMVGFDNLIGDATYHPDFPQTVRVAQWKWGLEQQFDQFRGLPEHVRNKCILQPFGQPLNDIIRMQG